MWRQQAEVLFFMEHLSISDIAVLLTKARETVSRHITKCDGYSGEIQRRREQSATARTEYQRNWDRTRRNRVYTEGLSDCFEVVTHEIIKKEQATAARILSLERYDNY